MAIHSNVLPGRRNSLTDTKSITSCSSKQSSSKYKTGASPYLSESKLRVFKSKDKRSEQKTRHPSALEKTFSKTNSDDLIASKKANNKKTKKSVLTLPNNPTPKPRDCTASETNDSGFFKECVDKKPHVPRNRFTTPSGRNTPQVSRYRDFSLGIMRSGSFKLMSSFDGDAKKIVPRSRIKPLDYDAHSVWAMLRDLDRFRYDKSPPASEIGGRKKQNKINVRNLGVTKTFREHIELVTDFDVCNKSISQASSSDRITVIDRDEILYLDRDFDNNVEGPDSVFNQYNYKQQDTLKSRASNKDFPKRTHITRATNKPIVETNKPVLCRSATQHENTSSKKCDVLTQKMYEELMDAIAPKMYIKPKTIERKAYQYSDDQNIIYDRETRLRLCSRNDKLKTNYGKAEYNRNPFPGRNSRAASEEHMGGITKVIMNNHGLSQSNHTPRRQSPNKIYSYFTKEEINRHLAKLKFPIVVVNKDEIRPVPIGPHIDSIQFQGLDRHIWPFMEKWNTPLSNSSKPSAKRVKIIPRKGNERNIDKFKQPAKKGKFNSDQSKCLYSNPMFRGSKLTLSDNSSKSVIRKSSIITLKDKMLKILYKDTPTSLPVPESFFSRNCSNQHDAYDYSGDHREYSFDMMSESNKATRPRYLKRNVTTTQSRMSKKKMYVESNLSATDTRRNIEPSLHKLRHSTWSKTSWADECVENIIKNVSNGVYSSPSDKVMKDCAEKQSVIEFKHFANTETKEMSIQTSSSIIINASVLERISTGDSSIGSATINNSLIRDEGLFKLEVKSLDPTKVSVKNCATNVMVQFDVSISKELVAEISPKSSLTCIPVTVTSSHTQIFKSQTTILNAALPAQLCTILPQLMKKIINSKRATFTLEKPVIELKPHLSVISELPSSDIQKISSTMIQNITNPSSVQHILKGMFVEHLIRTTTPKKCLSARYTEVGEYEGLRQFSCSKNICIQFYIHPLNCIQDYSQNTQQTNIMITEYINDQPNECLALVPYDPNINLLRKIATESDQERSVALLNIMTTYLLCKMKNNNLSVFVNILNVYEQPREDIECVNDKTLILRFSGKMKPKSTESCTNIVPYNREIPNSQEMSEPLNRKSSSKIKITRKGFVKLYKKCKSTSNITSERCSTSLSRITNVEEFIQALGASKTLASVLDKSVEKKILNCIRELKNWISVIRPRQALLVMLLCNKKDTQILNKFRPVLLQGIAVNRITKTCELEMEIEVFENENIRSEEHHTDTTISLIHKTSKEQMNNIFEELCWIAKTTASDYQKPFDSTSEKLLKSLLGKRKKLNPSYLRVMARYVGLGLLKEPKELKH